MANRFEDEEAIFMAALDRKTPGERIAFLAGACRGDEALRARVEALLTSHEEATDFLQPAEPSPPNATRLHEPATVEGPGTLIGPYKLLQRLGEGGMGTVYMAEQEHPIARRVALKVIKPGMDSRQVIARFEAERQALSLMDHPSIAKVLDAGTTAGGRPYFVMELVKGIPITRFCDQEHLTPHERLPLFVTVCQAVQHAHQKGIIHRDLKPSNVLIALYDGVPVPKVIDFGVAKATGRRLTEQTMFTELGQIVGTLEYMSPEQAELNNLDIDTRADIYSLGVILYELLTGTRPFDAKRLREVAFAEMLRIIREEEPQKPSTRLSSSGDALPAISAQRKMEPAKLSKLLAGDLDWIVMKALAKERNRRYASATDFAADLERFVHDEAVLAGPPTLAYKLRKFVRRNRAAVAAGVTIASLLVVGVAVSSWLAVVANRAESVALANLKEKNEALEAETAAVAEKNIALETQKAAKEAEAEQRKQAEAVAALLEIVLRGLDLNRPVTELKAQLIQSLGDADLEKEYASEPLTRAKLRHALGVTLFGLGEYDKAAPMFDKAAGERLVRLGADDPATLESRIGLARAYLADRNWTSAIPIFEDAVSRLSAVNGGNHLDALRGVVGLADSYQRAGKIDMALALLDESLPQFEALLRADHIDMVLARAQQGRTLYAAGKAAEAVVVFDACVPALQERLGTLHLAALRANCYRAVAYSAGGRKEKAAQILQIFESTWAALEEDPAADLDELVQLAQAMADEYRSDIWRSGSSPMNNAFEQAKRAVHLEEDVVTLLKARRGPDHRDTLKAMARVARGYQRLARESRYANPATEQKEMQARAQQRSAELYHEVLPLLTAELGNNDDSTLLCMSNLALLHLESDESERALPLFEKVYRLIGTKRGADHIDTAEAAIDLAWTYDVLDKPKLSVPIYERALIVFKATRGESHASTLDLMDKLSDAYFQAGNRDACLTLAEKRVDLLLSTLDAKVIAELPPISKRSYNLDLEADRKAYTASNTVRSIESSVSDLASRYADAGRIGDAVKTCEKARDCIQQLAGPAQNTTLRTAWFMIELLERAGQIEQAKALSAEALNAWEGLPPNKASWSPRLNAMSVVNPYYTRQRLAEICAKSGDHAKALELWEENLRRIRDDYGPDTEADRWAISGLAWEYLEAGQTDKAVPLLEGLWAQCKSARSNQDLTDFQSRDLTNLQSEVIAGFERAGDDERVAALCGEWIELHKKKGDRVVDVLEAVERIYVRQGRFADAERLLRERRALGTEGTFDMYFLESDLGQVLQKQEQYAEAEVFLLNACKGAIPIFMERATEHWAEGALEHFFDRLIVLYDAWGKPEMADRFRIEREQTV